MRWFKMDCDAQDNLDLRVLIDEWGWDWYGRYWAILGKIGMLVNESNLTFCLQTNNGRPFPVKQLSNDLSTNVERLTNFLDFLADNHLIDKESWQQKNLIYSPKLKNRADEYTRKLLTDSAQTTETLPSKKKKKIRLDEEEIKSRRAFAVLPALGEVVNFCLEHNIPTADAEYYHLKWQENGFKNGGRAILDWHLTLLAHQKAGYLPSQKVNNGHTRRSNGQTERATYDGTPDADSFARRARELGGDEPS